MAVTAMPAASAEQAEQPPKKGGKGKLIVIILVVVLALAGAGRFLLKPSSAPAEAKPGEVVSLEPIQVNLAAGHYLRVGVALQLVEGASEIDGSKALDATIALFSGKSMDELLRAEQREQLKEELGTTLSEKYEGDVMGVYFTDFVTQ